MSKQSKQKTNTKKPLLSTQPYKGARDFYPEDMRVRNYIFDIWRKVCKSYGFEEYDPPLLEQYEIYKAKSGEEIVNRQLYSFIDKGGRNVAIRPEKTPSLARMVAKKINELPYPIKWFNIGNCWRFEKPQKGRGREFYQFDCDILGVKDVTADVEVFSIPIIVMKEFGATEKMFEIRVSNRRFMEYYLAEIVKLQGSISKIGTQMYKVVKIIDSKSKISDKLLKKQLLDQKVSQKQLQLILKLLETDDIKIVKKYEKNTYGAKELIEFFELTRSLGFGKYIKFKPEITRGLDYYTGNVIEQFDLNKDNKRSMYGGGRYDNLVGIFSCKEITGVGFAIGDIPLLEFLKSWNLLPKFKSDTKVMVTMFSEDFRKNSMEIATKLRNKGINTIAYLEADKLEKQFKYADKKGIPYVITQGPNEARKATVQFKNMKTKIQKEMALDEAIQILKK